MTRLEHVQVEAMDLHRFESVISSAQYSELLALIQRAAGRLRGRVIWNVNSTAKGGGVVELLRPLLGYSRGGGVDARWVVISGDSDFFVITKRLHNHLHGIDGDGGPLSADEHASYERTLAANAVELARLVRPSDVVILHDPQTAGLVGAVSKHAGRGGNREPAGHSFATQHPRHLGDPRALAAEQFAQLPQALTEIVGPLGGNALDGGHSDRHSLRHVAACIAGPVPELLLDP
jgi:Trehalose synthase, N-terminal domain